MRRFSKMLKITGAVMAAAAMLVTVNAGAVVTQAKTTQPAYQVSVAKHYVDKQKEKNMQANVKIPKVKVIGTNGKVMPNVTKKLNTAVAKYQNSYINMYKKDVSAVKKGENGNEALTSTYKVITNNTKLFSLRVDTVIDMGGSQSYVKIFHVDKKTGKMITLKNLFKNGSNYMDRISDNIKEQMRMQMKADENKMYFIDDVMPGNNFDKISDDADFYINKNGKLTIVFDKYEVAPGAMGIVTFSIPTSVIKDITTVNYLK